MQRSVTLETPGSTCATACRHKHRFPWGNLSEQRVARCQRDPNAHDAVPPHISLVPSKQLRHTARYLALLVAALLIVLSVALFGVFGGQLRRGKAAAVTATSTPASCPASALSATIPADAIIQDISMTSPRDGWAVGWIPDYDPPR